MKTELPSSRRFNLLDAAILIALVAATLAIARSLARSNVFSDLREVFQWDTLTRSPRSVFRLWTLLPPAYPVLATWSLGLLLIRLRRPQPRPSRLWRQPGFVATVAACFIVAANFLEKYGPIVYRYWGNWGGWFTAWSSKPDFWFRFLLPEGSDSPQVGPAVAAAWFVLAVSGRWRAEAGWIDQAGRVVGFLWIAVYSIPLFGSFLWY